MANSSSTTGDRLYGSVEGEFLFHSFGTSLPQGLSPFRVMVTQNKIIGITVPGITKTVNLEATLDDAIAAPKSVERTISDLTRVYIVQGKAGKEYSHYAEATYHQARDFNKYAFVFFAAINRYLSIVIPMSDAEEVRGFIAGTPLAPKMMLMGKRR